MASFSHKFQLASFKLWPGHLSHGVVEKGGLNSRPTVLGALLGWVERGFSEATFWHLELELLRPANPTSAIWCVYYKALIADCVRQMRFFAQMLL